MRTTLRVDGMARAIDGLVTRMLESANVRRPPVDALLVACRLGIAVVEDHFQASRGRHVRIAGRPTIFVRPEERAERLQWAVAHELGEALCCPAFELAQIDVEEAGDRAREQAANMLASRLLLPTAWFAACAQQTENDLAALKEQFSTASHELVALRLLDQEQPLVVTVFDHGRVTRRACNCAPRVPPLAALERECQRMAHRQGRPVTRQAEGIWLRAWPVHEPHWRREILVAGVAKGFACPDDDWEQAPGRWDTAACP